MDNYEEDVVEETTTEETSPEVEETTEEEVEIDWKAEAEKEKEARLKAERAIENAKKKKDKAPVASNGLSPKDLIAITKAQIETDDLDEVLDYANYKGISIAEALDSSILKATLAEKAEHRKSAQAVNTGATRRANTTVSDDRLLADARSGKMPESEADIAKLVQARLKK